MCSERSADGGDEEDDDADDGASLVGFIVPDDEEGKYHELFGNECTIVYITTISSQLMYT